MESIKKNFILNALAISFMAFFIEVLMLIMYYPAPIEPFNISKVLITLIYYCSLFVFGIIFAHSSRYGKSFVWMFGIFILVSVIFSYSFSNISYIFMKNNLGAQMGEFKNLMPRIMSLTIFINIPILIFGYSVSFIIHSIYGRYDIKDSRGVEGKKLFLFSILILVAAIVLFVPTVYNIDDIGSYWNRVVYNVSLNGNENTSTVIVKIVNHLNAKIEIINLYIPLYNRNGNTDSLGLSSFNFSKIINRDSKVIFSKKIDKPFSELRLGKTYIKFLYKGKLLRKDY